MATETTIARPAPYIEALGQQYGKDLTALTAKAMPTAGYAPTVAGQDQAQLDAYTQSNDTRSRYRGLPTLPYSSWSLLRTWSRYWSRLYFCFHVSLSTTSYRCHNGSI